LIVAGDMRVALTIAGSDPTGGAGLQADLKTFASLGVYGLSVTTAITAQSTVGVVEAAGLSADLVTSQIEAVAADINVHATKTGMLGKAAIVEAVAASIKEMELPFVVVDPVLASSRGDRLLDDDGVQMLCAELLPLAHVVTPNVPEAEALSGKRIESDEDVKEAARRIYDLGAPAVLITGGHRPLATGHRSPTTGHRSPSTDPRPPEVIDVLFDGHRFLEFHTARVDTPGAHGTGCAFSAAIAAYLALGHPLVDAAERAQRYVAAAIRNRMVLGHGQGLLDHFWGGILKE
jgi:hydroxymethylpyrimidine/phosphomethylpyrimidine kinase